MLDIMSRLSSLHRPRLLVRTARMEAANYCRKRDLSRILGYGSLPKPAAAIMRLLDLEHEINQRRLSGDAGYMITTHIETLIALMGEANYLAPGSSQNQLPLHSNKKRGATLLAAPPTLSP